MKHYVPNHMLAPKDNLYHLSLLSPNRKKSEKGHNSIMYGIYSKFIQVIYTNCVLNITILELEWLPRYFVHNVPYA